MLDTTELAEMSETELQTHLNPAGVAGSVHGIISSNGRDLNGERRYFPPTENEYSLLFAVPTPSSL
jgi:hypothetical protein